MSRAASQTPAHVVFALVGDVRRSSRALRQLRWLVEAGYKVTAISFGSDDEGGIEGVQLKVLEPPTGTGPAFFWKAHRKIKSAALAIEADIYHASDLYSLPAMCAAADRHGGAVVYDSRELYPHVDATAGKPWARAVWTIIERAHIKRPRLVMTVNESIAERIAAAYDIERPLVLYNLPDPRPSTTDTTLRERLDIGKDTPIVLYQGLLREGRGLPTLIDAMTRVPDAALVIIGEGPQREEITQLASDRLGPRARLLPFILPDDLAALTPSADVGVCILEPISESVRLALPNKLFEYLLAGLPVIASDLPEVRRVVDDFAVGLTVAVDEPEALAQAIEHAITDEAAQKKWRRNIPKVFRRFNVQEARRRFLQAYEDLPA